MERGQNWVGLTMDATSYVLGLLISRYIQNPGSVDNLVIMV